MNNLLENTLLILLTVLITKMYHNYKDHKQFFRAYGEDVPCRRCTDIGNESKSTKGSVREYVQNLTKAPIEPLKESRKATLRDVA
jgi:hypothetical protein